MEWNIHYKIARSALKLRYLDFDRVSEILTELGARAASEEDVPVTLWREPDRLSKEQLEAILKSEEPGDDKGEEHPVGLVEDTTLAEAGGKNPEEHFVATATQKISADLQFYEELKPGEAEEFPLDDHTKPGQEQLGNERTNPFTDISTATIEVSADDKDASEKEPQNEEKTKTASGHSQSEPPRVSQTLQDVDFDLAFERTGLYQPPRPMADVIEAPDRYELGAELGRGGGGRVVEARDRVLKRQVAMKLFRPTPQQGEAGVRRFLAEAQAACQLEHPNIIPVYDVGIRDDGTIFYTMHLVEQHSLEDVLQGLRRGESEYLEEYSLLRLLTILSQVSRAIDYAHDAGVIHRDLKPGNIMIGRFGEVSVMDWGLAYVSGSGVTTELSEQGEDVAGDGYTVGTPAYMAPEQARGTMGEVDEQSDVYALGAVLYEILTLRPPFEREGPVETMWSVIESELVSPGQCNDHGLWEVPEDLEQICLTALAREKEKRYPSAGAFFDALERFVDGVRPRRALRQVEEGRRAVEEYLDKKSKITELTRKIDVLREEFEPWDPIEQKRRLWKLEDERRSVMAEKARVFGEAVFGFQRALTNDDQCDTARQELAELYWERYCEAEQRGDDFEKIYFATRIREAREATYWERLAPTVKVDVQTRPVQAEVTLFPLEEIDRRLVVTDKRDLGRTPVKLNELEVGSYLLVLQAEQKAVVRAPLYARRGEAVDMRIGLPPEELASVEFAFIAGGPCIVGGDPEAINPRGRRVIEVRSFFCANLPVTFRQYLQFLDDRDREEAEHHIPRCEGNNQELVAFDEAGGRWKPNAFLGDSADTEVSAVPMERLMDLPVVAITAADAEAYCRWRSERDGIDYRLPRMDEWEKAGRGVDGRLYSWGDHFDATFCKMQQSRPGGSQLEEVGVFVDDVSPYGVRDLSGGVHEWCVKSGDGSQGYVIRGGAWNQGERACRLASTRRISGDRRAMNIGMRLVYDAPFDDGWSGAHIASISDD